MPELRPPPPFPTTEALCKFGPYQTEDQRGDLGNAHHLQIVPSNAQSLERDMAILPHRGDGGNYNRPYLVTFGTQHEGGTRASEMLRYLVGR